MSLTGNASLTDYQSLPSEISYQDNGTDTSTGSHPQHTITWSINDGTASGSTTSLVTINRPPVVTAANVTMNANVANVSAASLFTASDPDSDAITIYAFKDTGAVISI